jgi:catechol 2,3-dioxygenase-like lactoylglutathione lyase family enzyme
MANKSPLGSRNIIAFVPTRSPERAKKFYGDTLGLRLLSEDQFAIVFDANGIMLRVSVVGELVPAKHTVLGWQVPDVVTAAKDLHEAGVTFERFEGMQQDETGIWTSPGGGKIAWFKDPDGNTLSITEF